MLDYSRKTESRLKILGALVLLSTFVLVWRLFDLQIFQHNHYVALAESQQQFSKVEIAQRGKIYVHDSFVDPKSYYPLAFDVKKFSIWVVPNQVSKKEETAAALSPLVGLTPDDIFNRINNDKLYIPPVAKSLTLDSADKVKALNLSGTYIVPEYSRYYPEGMLAAHILGFVNAEGEGNYGFEGMYDAELKGTSGNVKGEKDTLGRVINLIEQKDAQDGTSFVLTIDRSVQYFTEKKLNEALQTYQASSGSVLIMDIKTGGIVAMASAPSYDPNNFRDYAKDNSSIFVNPSVGHLYEPGSIFKPLTMSAAIDKGLLQPETTGTFDWRVTVDGFEIKTAERKAFGLESMTQVLQNSDNVAMVWVSQLLGKENEYDYIKKYHMFDKTGIDLSGEAIGYAPQFKQWKDINQATIAFGQGISVTPMEMLAAYATIANKGVYIRPHIVDKIILPDGTEKRWTRKRTDV